MNLHLDCHRLTIYACALLVAMASLQQTQAETISLPAMKDNTLLRYDPDDVNTALNSNGSGDFFSAGLSFSRNEIRRGLIQFDLTGVPKNSQVVPGTVHLRLRVIGIPRRDSTPRPFWVVGLSGTFGQWGEGASDVDVATSGSGSGAPAQLGDATWFHTTYNTQIHDPTSFVSGGAGYWIDQGAIGNAAISDPAGLFGPAAGTAGSTEDYVDFTSESMENDVRLWLTDPKSNKGWIVVGDEGVSGPDASSKRDFASREHENVDFHPVLTFEVISVPEASTIVLCVVGILIASLNNRHRCGIMNWSKHSARAE